MSRLQRRALAAALTLLGVLAIGRTRPLSAHPTATTVVTITISADERRLDLAIATDADALLLKLEALSGGALSASPLAPAARDARLEALQQTLLDRIDLRVDDARAELHFTGITAVEGQPDVIRLTGLVPPGATRAVWRTTLVYGSYPIVIEHAGAAKPAVQWLQGPQASQPFAIDARATITSGMDAVWRYFSLGFTHILPHGLDHILFVLGLFLLTPRLRSVVAQATAFTVAHSITLGLTLYGAVSVPSSIVEPLIALSIAYVALENLFTSKLRTSRLALVFGFGLLHGMGFAEALSRLDLPRSEFLTTLLTFNAGVEAGQLAVIAAAFVAVRVWAVPSVDYRRLVVRPASAAIALTGLFWVIERLI